MSHATEGLNDFDKLKLAFGEITRSFGSVDAALGAFGLADMPTAQRYGILFGCIVFFGTVTAVFCLMFFGGTFQRIMEESGPTGPTTQAGYKMRLGRPLLLERLLEARKRMLDQNYPDRETPKERPTPLTKMLVSVPPPKKDDGKNKARKQDDEQASAFQKNYAMAYRDCQDKPGGGIMSGRPEARFEAYARAFAGCGDFTSLSYRRSYARNYEAIACYSHETDDKYSGLYETEPDAIIGKHVRLNALDAMKHLAKIYDATSGFVYFEHKSFDPNEVWGFQPEGPFSSPKEMHGSFVFRHRQNESAFCITDNVTDRIMGVVMLSHDDPQNLSIQLNPPIMGPVSFGGKHQLEACFLLLDRLFAHGYRRVQMSIDAKDIENVKVADRLGFTFEGCLLKHMIVKEASRDSNVYGMLNSDWDKGARMALFKKLYGTRTAQIDISNIKKGEEFDNQQRVLAEKELQEKKQKKA